VNHQNFTVAHKSHVRETCITSNQACKNRVLWLSLETESGEVMQDTAQVLNTVDIIYHDKCNI